MLRDISSFVILSFFVERIFLGRLTSCFRCAVDSYGTFSTLRLVAFYHAPVTVVKRAVVLLVDIFDIFS